MSQIFNAHRGFNTVAPENSLPAFASAVALGANEIELDLWPTKDGRIIVCHDSTVDRTSNGTGQIVNLTFEEIKQLDAGSYFADGFRGLRFSAFEDILNEFGRKVIMNIHIKSLNDNPYQHPEMKERGKELMRYYGENIIANLDEHEPQEVIIQAVEDREVTPYDEEVFKEIVRLIYKYGCQESVYITGEKDVLITALKVAPELERCCLEGHMNFSIIEHALEFKCSRVQFCKHFVTKNMIKKANDNQLIANLFWSNDYDEAQHFFNHGIDVVLTDDYLRTTVKN